MKKIFTLISFLAIFIVTSCGTGLEEKKLRRDLEEAETVKKNMNKLTDEVNELELKRKLASGEITQKQFDSYDLQTHRKSDIDIENRIEDIKEKLKKYE